MTLFEAEGFGVKHIGKRGDFGTDLALMSGDTKTVVQAKRWIGSVGPGAVKEVAAALARYRARNRSSPFLLHRRSEATSEIE